MILAGTCFIKLARVYSDSIYGSRDSGYIWQRPNFKVDMGMDFVGSDIKMLTGLSFVACGKSCLLTTGCKFFSHANITDSSGTAGDCWLRSAKTQVIEPSVTLATSPKPCLGH